MAEDRGISMNEFKTVVESFRSDIKKVVEVINRGFENVGKDIQEMKTDISGLKAGQAGLQTDVASLKTGQSNLQADMSMVKEQIGLLLEGQTELRAGLKERVTYQEFKQLDKRVTRLEKKIA